jgi:hypothetical protein
MATAPRKTNRLLLLEVAMVLLLIVLAIVFYLRPAGEGTVAAPWWKWMLIAALFFAAVGLRTWRRRGSAHSALHQVIREEAAKME